MEPLHIQPGHVQPLEELTAAPGHHVEIELDRQPAKRDIQLPEKKPADKGRIALHVAAIVGIVAVAPIALALSPFILLGSIIGNSGVKDDDDDPTPLYALVLEDVKDAFKPLTDQIEGIKSAYQGKTLKEYKKEKEKEAKHFERDMQSIQTVEYSRQQISEARNAPNQPPVDATNINKHDNYGLTPLMKAQTAGEVQELLSMQADIHVKDEQGLTALKHFAYAGNEECVRALLATNKLSRLDCFWAAEPIRTILKHERDPDAREKYETILRALHEYRPPPQLPPQPQQRPQEQRQEQVQREQAQRQQEQQPPQLANPPQQVHNQPPPPPPPPPEHEI